MIDGSEKRTRQLAFELQNSHVCEKGSKSNTRLSLISFFLLFYSFPFFLSFFLSLFLSFFLSLFLSFFLSFL